VDLNPPEARQGRKSMTSLQHKRGRKVAANAASTLRTTRDNQPIPGAVCERQRPPIRAFTF